MFSWYEVTEEDCRGLPAHWLQGVLSCDFCRRLLYGGGRSLAPGAGSAGLIGEPVSVRGSRCRLNF